MLKSKPTSAIVILNWNCAETIYGCIESLLDSTAAQHIVVVDNDSTDGSMKSIAKRYPDVVRIYNDKNLGFSGGVNVGLKYAAAQGYKYAALINPDAWIEDDWLEKLESVLAERPEVGIATGKLLKPDSGEIDAAGDLQSDWLLPYHRGEDESPDKFNEPGYVAMGTAAASLYRIETLKDINFFDSKGYFIYYEDSDLAIRAQLRGWRSYYEPLAIGYHKKNSSSKKVPAVVIQQSLRNRHLLVIKTTPGGVLLRHGYKFFLSAPLFYFNQILKGHPIAATRSIIGVITVTPYALKQRRKIMKRRKIDSSQFTDRVLTQGPPPIKMLEYMAKLLR